MGIPEINDGYIDLPLAKQPGTGGEKMMVDESGEGQTARTRYRVIDRAGNRAAWVELQPRPGAPTSCACTWPRSATPSSVTANTAGRPHSFRVRSAASCISMPGASSSPIQKATPSTSPAPLPEHFAASLAQLGFTESEGDLPLEQPQVIDPRDAQKRAARAHSKDLRKERRGERRKRGDRAKSGRARNARASRWKTETDREARRRPCG
jgi:23S rRNA pseudouridine955/2504/2580 synthase